MLDLVMETLTQHIGRDPEAVTPSTRLDQLDVDSLALLELLCTLEDEHNVRVPDEIGDIHGGLTLTEIADLLERAQPEALPGQQAPVDPVTAGGSVT
ncbi:phosphopantetheine-binding protein [Streptomyces aurantiacus]|uniref:Carrier domain-containing protein n=1 Tax=Streptomyces aurantiacus JA 4570 TaxID=1286094 RepID=S3ZSG5_9ACTN|nr:phosphopantetheine-binding protein [Streptomyces aurantiacus]EPH46083.1 hypothetical protein STRAU_0819 [Streptomyces aurantiacus JA 4570]